MANRRPVIPDDLQQLLDLVAKGRLFAIQEWIKSGKRVRVPADADNEAMVLRAAISAGFHSLIEELLRAGGWSSDELGEALELARYRKRYDLAELLLSYGAQPKQLDFQTCCRELDL